LSPLEIRALLDPLKRRASRCAKRPTVGGRTDLEVRFEGAREVRLVVKADHGRDLGERPALGADQDGGTLEAAFTHKSAQRFSEGRAERTRKMPGADAAMIGESGQIEFTGGIGFDLVEYDREPRCAAGPGQTVQARGAREQFKQ